MNGSIEQARAWYFKMYNLIRNYESIELLFDNYLLNLANGKGEIILTALLHVHDLLYAGELKKVNRLRENLKLNLEQK